MLNTKVLGEAAQRYAEYGIPIFPLYGTHGSECDCGKPDCSSPGKHPRTPNGFKDATFDSDQVRAWWQQWPNANIGMPTGDSSLFWVIDIDPPDGERSFEALRNGYPELPEVPIQLTGRQGHHLFFAYSRPIQSRNGGLGPHVDVKAEGGYVVLAPSRHVSGRNYEWERSLELGPVEAPDWLLQKVLSPPTGMGNGGPETGQGATFGGDGHRNFDAFRMARSFRFKGVSEEKAFAALRGVKFEQPEGKPFTERELRAAVANAYKQPDRQDFVEEQEAAAFAHRWADRLPTDAFDAWQTISNEPRVYLWDGLVRKGGTCAITGLMAAGKTTLMLNVVRGWALGDTVLDRPCVPSRTLVIVSPKEYDNWAEMIGFWNIERGRVFLVESPKAHFARPELAAEWFNAMMQHYECQTFALDTLFDFFGTPPNNPADANRLAMNEQAPLLAVVREQGYCGIVGGHAPKSEARAKDPRDPEESFAGHTGWMAQHRMRMTVRRKAQGYSSVISGRGGYGDRGILEEQWLAYDEKTRLVNLGGLWAQHLGLAALPSVLETLAVIGGWASMKKLCDEMERGEKWVRPGLKEGIRQGLIKDNGRPSRGKAYALVDAPDEQTGLFS